MTDDQYFMIECITTELVVLVMEQFHVDMKAAMEMVYSSNTYNKLTDPLTGLYYQSPLYVYDVLQEELSGKNAEIQQKAK